MATNREKLSSWSDRGLPRGFRAAREKVFGPGRAVPLDRNAKIRIAAYARGWSARSRQPGQHKGPITRAFLDVLQALLWAFHNSRSGACFPSHSAIAARAGCCRSTVIEALKVLEWAGVLSWQHRITKVREQCVDLFGRQGWRWRVLRTSNAYQFHDRQAAEARQIPSVSKNQAGTQNQYLIGSVSPPAIASDTLLERALARFGNAISSKEAHEEGVVEPTAA
jgi:hypothetical protein